MSYVDLHLHLLPALDDGARDLDAALRHARRLHRDGVHQVLLTPHIGNPAFDIEVASLPRRTAELQAAIDREGLLVRLHTGGELYPEGTGSLPAKDLDLLAQGPPGSRWLLLEVPFAGIDPQFVAVASDLHARGYGLVIAHPERAQGLLDGGLFLLRPLLRAGAVLQVNGSSLAGDHGAEAQRAGEQLLRSRLAYVLASDGHPGMREDTLKRGHELARQAGVSAVQAWQLTQANPRFLLEHGLPQLPARAGAPAAWRRARSAQIEAARRAAGRG